MANDTTHTKFILRYLARENIGNGWNVAMSVSENELETIERRRKGDLKAKMIRDNKRNGVDNSTNRNIHALCLSSEISLSLLNTQKMPT